MTLKIAALAPMPMARGQHRHNREPRHPREAPQNLVQAHGDTYESCGSRFDILPERREASLKVKCFGCDAVIEADADGIVDAFVAHGQQSHTWSYPEEAIRNYARNYADAT